eukprot:g52720.t1
MLSTVLSSSLTSSDVTVTPSAGPIPGWKFRSESRRDTPLRFVTDLLCTVHFMNFNLNLESILVEKKTIEDSCSESQFCSPGHILTGRGAMNRGLE